MANIHHFDGFSVVDGDIKIDLNLSRMDDNFNKAQFALDSAVMTSMVPFMPMEDGTFINETKSRSATLSGTGEVCAAAPPQGRFLYEGKTMVDVETGSPWARKGAQKVLVSEYAGKTRARKNLQYTKTKHPKAQDHWFEAAKKQDEQSWIRTAKKVAGGGK